MKTVHRAMFEVLSREEYCKFCEMMTPSRVARIYRPGALRGKSMEGVRPEDVLTYCLPGSITEEQAMYWLPIRSRLYREENLRRRKARKTQKKSPLQEVPEL